MNYLKILIDIFGKDIGKLICKYLYISNMEININNSSKNQLWENCYNYKIKLESNIISIPLVYIYEPSFENYNYKIYCYINKGNIKINIKIDLIIKEMIHLHYLENYTK